MTYIEMVIEDALRNEITNQRRLYSAAVVNKDDSDAQKIWERIQEIKTQLNSLHSKEERTMKKLEEMTSKELKEMAKGLQVANWWNLKKAELIKGIEAKQKEKKLHEHYEKNWRKYGPKNDWVKFLKDYNDGKITLVDEEKKEEKKVVKMPSKAQKQASKEVSEEPKQNIKREVKKPNKKLTELTYKGETKTIREWAAQLEMPWPTLYDRVNRNGWSVEDAIETPLGQRRAK